MVITSVFMLEFQPAIIWLRTCMVEHIMIIHWLIRQTFFIFTGIQMMKIMIKDLKAMLKEKGRIKLPSEMYFSRKKCFTPNLYHVCIEVSICTNKFVLSERMHTESFDWFLSGLEFVYKNFRYFTRNCYGISDLGLTLPHLEFLSLFVWSKLKLFAQKMKILIKHM